MTTRVTLATVRAFIRKHRTDLLIAHLSEFDPSVDGVRSTDSKAFHPAKSPEEGHNFANHLGIAGAWFVFGSRDYFTPIERDGVTGYHVYNCCGSFDIGIQKAA